MGNCICRIYRIQRQENEEWLLARPPTQLKVFLDTNQASTAGCVAPPYSEYGQGEDLHELQRERERNRFCYKIQIGSHFLPTDDQYEDWDNTQKDVRHEHSNMIYHTITEGTVQVTKSTNRLVQDKWI